MDAEESEKKTKTFQKGDLKVFENSLELTGMEPGAMCAALGYTRNAYNHWRKEGAIPKVVEIAVRQICQDHLRCAVVFASPSTLEIVKKIVNSDGGAFRSVRF